MTPPSSEDLAATAHGSRKLHGRGLLLSLYCAAPPEPPVGEQPSADLSAPSLLCPKEMAWPEAVGALGGGANAEAAEAVPVTGRGGPTPHP